MQGSVDNIQGSLDNMQGSVDNVVTLSSVFLTVEGMKMLMLGVNTRAVFCTWSLLYRVDLGSGTLSSLAAPAPPTFLPSSPPPSLRAGEGLRTVYLDFWPGDREGTWRHDSYTRGVRMVG